MNLFEAICANDTAAVTRAIAADPAGAVAARDEYLGSTPLIFAAHRGFTDIVIALLAAGADVAAREAASDSTALHWAAEGGHPLVARMLLERGAALEPRDGWHALTPLGWATVVSWAPAFREDRPATIDLLMEAGARHDLFSAVATENADTVEALVARDRRALSARLGFVDDGMTPLHVAAARGLADMAARLVRLGADRGLRTARGLTPLAVALERGQAAAADALGGDDGDLACAVVRGDVDAARARLDVGTAGEVAGPLAFVAVERGDVAMVRLLLTAGVDPRARRRHLVGELPGDVSLVHVAEREGHAAVVDALVAAGGG